MPARRPPSPALLWLLLWLAWSGAMAESRLEVIELSHLTGARAEALLRPLAGPGVGLSHYNNQLIVRAEPAEIARLRGVLAEVDRPLRTLLVSVRQTMDQGYGMDRGDFAGRLGEGEPSLRGRLSGRSGERHDDAGQKVRVLEGGWAFIRTGTAVPVPERSYDPRSGTIRESSRYLAADSGFYARARVTGDGAIIDISPRQARLSGPGPAPALEARTIATTISAPLGEWVEVGGAAEYAAGRAAAGGIAGGTPGAAGGGGYARIAGGRGGSVWLRVEVIGE
ncbi:MAG: hypothetical protein PHF72_10275 [Gammaproteobacteria bacterium]|nr:hypothetical protein [Gammaproteobacteria bacterium]